MSALFITLAGYLAYRDNGTTPGGSRMWCPSNNVLTGKQPVAPTKAPHVVQCLQIQNSRLPVLDNEATHIDFLCFGVDVGKELTVRERAVSTEFVKNLGERG